MKRAKHNLSHAELLTGKMGILYPVGVTEVLPGDTFQHHASVFCRLSPLATPVLHRVRMRIHHFFVPFRLIWQDFEDFITGGADGLQTPVVPYMASVDLTGAGSLGNHLGFPIMGAAMTPCALPFRAYQLIWNEYFRDQDLETEAAWAKTSGSDATTESTIKRVCWNKDYFTSARPFPSKGADVTVGIGSLTPVMSSGSPTARPIFRDATSGNPVQGAITTDAAGKPVVSGVADLTIDPNGSLVIPGNQGQISLSEFRESAAILRYQEARARYGSRFTEYLAYLGVRSSDARLQRPEYLGGGTEVVQFSEVLQTAPVSGAGVGNMAGHGIGAMRSNRYRKFFEEHGYCISLLSIVPEALYTQSIPRKYLRQSKEDFYQKELEHVGQQEILQGEVYAGTAIADATFGYQDRYAEYRQEESRVHGDFLTTLDSWHLGRVFASEPALNASFVSCEPTDRVFQDQTGTDTLWMRVQHSLVARRMVSNNTSSKVM